MMRVDAVCDISKVEPSRIDESLSEEERTQGKPYRPPLKFWRGPLETLNPVRRARGLFVAPTRALYERWKRARERW